MAVSINQEKIKDLLLAKGDKLALAVGGGVAALLLVWGVVSAASAPSPSATIKELTDGATRVNGGVNGPGEDAPDLPKWVKGTVDFKPIDPAQFAGVGKPFEPVFKPNTLAENPQVVGLSLSQMDVVRLPYKAYDIRDNDDGSRWIGVLKDKKPDTKDVRALADAMRGVTLQVQGRLPPGRNTNNRPPQPPPTPPGFPPGMGGGGPPPGMGGPPPGMGGGGPPPGMGGRGMGGLGGSMGGGYGGGMGGMMGGAGARTDATVEYVPPDEVAKGNLVVAQSVAPLRAVMVHGLIPLREQRLEYQRALKVPPKFDPRTGEPVLTDVPPVEYAGFDVQRRVTAPSGQTSEWTDYDHLERFFTEIRARAYGFTVEQGLLSKFVRYNEPLATPLPIVADELYEYPRLRMKPVDDAIEKMKQAGIQPPTPSDWEKRLGKFDEKSGNPFDPRPGAGGTDFGGGMGYGGSMGGMGEGGMMGRGGPGGRMPGAGGPGGGSMGGPPAGMPGGPGGGYPGPGGRMPGAGGPGGGSMGGAPDGGVGGPGGSKFGGGKPGMGGGAGSPDGGMGGPGGGLGGQTYAQPETDHLLLRFLDIDVQPGFTYQYRVKLKLKNPNHGKKTGVARKADAQQETIEGVWVQLPDQITLPAESQLYAIDPQKYQDDFKTFYDDHKKEYALKRLAEVEALDAGRRAVVQVQQWQPTVRIDGTQKREPIGTWVVADLPVAPGEYVGKRTLVELPLWSAGLANYVLREMAGGVKVAGIKDPANQPKGWPINFRTPSVLVDFDGGRQVQRVGDREIRDDAAQELLIVRPDGKLVVRNSAEDMEDKTRKDRNDQWSAWLTRVKTRAVPAGGAGEGGGSNKPGGGGFNRP